MRRFAKPLYGLTPVPRVRIPPSPPEFFVSSAYGAQTILRLPTSCVRNCPQSVPKSVPKKCSPKRRGWSASKGCIRTDSILQIGRLSCVFPLLVSATVLKVSRKVSRKSVPRKGGDGRLPRDVLGRIRFFRSEDYPASSHFLCPQLSSKCPEKCPEKVFPEKAGMVGFQGMY